MTSPPDRSCTVTVPSNRAVTSHVLISGPIRACLLAASPPQLPSFSERSTRAARHQTRSPW